MTRPRRDGNELPFNQWIREHPQLGSSPHQAAICVTDLDFIIHKYIVHDASTGRVLARQHIQLIEHKAFGAEVPDHQGDTLGIFDQLLCASHKAFVHTKRGRKQLFYHGLHVCVFDGAGPYDSRSCAWDGREIDRQTLVELIGFERDPRTLRRREDRTHHQSQPALNETWLRAPAMEHGRDVG